MHPDGVAEGHGGICPERWSSQLAVAQLFLGGKRQVAEAVEVGEIGAPETRGLEPRAVEVRTLLQVYELLAQLLQIDELRAQFSTSTPGMIRWTQTADWAIV
jgi:hypothetical protein